MDFSQPIKNISLKYFPAKSGWLNWKFSGAAADNWLDPLSSVVVFGDVHERLSYNEGV